MATIFANSLQHEEILSTTYQLGTLELLRSLFPHQPGVVVVLPAQRVVLVLQLIESYSYHGRIRGRAQERNV